MTVNRILFWYCCYGIFLTVPSMIQRQSLNNLLLTSSDRIGSHTWNSLLRQLTTSTTNMMINDDGDHLSSKETKIGDIMRVVVEDLLYDKPVDVLTHFLYYVILIHTADSDYRRDMFWNDINTCPNNIPITEAPIIFVLGGPGCGKGTQCKRLVDDFGFTHISAGELLRDEAKSDTGHGKEILTVMKQGAIVPAKWTIDLLVKAIQNKHNPKGYLIDGFPRNVQHGPIFEEQIGKSCDLVLLLECSEETMVNRILERAGTSGREDDNEDTLRMRFQVFQTETMSAIDYYDSLGKVVRVDSEKEIDQVHEEVKNILTVYL